MQSEIYVDITGFEGKYQISNFGNVNSLNYNRTGRMQNLIPSKDKDGYLQIILWIYGKQKRFYLHRLVAMAFLTNPNNYEQVNHIVPNKENNHSSNLEWCSSQQNHDHAKLFGLKVKGEKHGNAKITEAIVIEIFRLRNVEKWSQKEIANKIGLNQSNVSCVLKRKNWKHVPIPDEYL